MEGCREQPPAMGRGSPPAPERERSSSSPADDLAGAGSGGRLGRRRVRRLSSPDLVSAMAGLQVDTSADAAAYYGGLTAGRFQQDLDRLRQRLQVGFAGESRALGQVKQFSFFVSRFLRKYPPRVLPAEQLKAVRSSLAPQCLNYLDRFLDAVVVMTEHGGVSRYHYLGFSRHVQIMAVISGGEPRDRTCPLFARIQERCLLWVNAELATLALQSALGLVDKIYHTSTIEQLMGAMEKLELEDALSEQRARLTALCTSDRQTGLSQAWAAIPAALRRAFCERQPYDVEQCLRAHRSLPPPSLHIACLLQRSFIYTQLDLVTDATPLAGLVDTLDKLLELEADFPVSISRLMALKDNIGTMATKIARIGLLSLQGRHCDSWMEWQRQRLCQRLGVLQRKGWLDAPCRQLLHECLQGMTYAPGLSDREVKAQLEYLEMLQCRGALKEAAGITCSLLAARGHIARLACADMLINRLEMRRLALYYPVIGWLLDDFHNLKKHYTDSDPALLNQLSGCKARCIANRDFLPLADSAKVEGSWRRIAGKSWIVSLEAAAKAPRLTEDMIKDLEELRTTTRSQLACELTRTSFQSVIGHILELARRRPGSMPAGLERLDALTRWSVELMWCSVHAHEKKRDAALARQLRAWPAIRQEVVWCQRGERAGSAAHPAGPGDRPGGGGWRTGRPGTVPLPPAGLAAVAMQPVVAGYGWPAEVPMVTPGLQRPCAPVPESAGFLLPWNPSVAMVPFSGIPPFSSGCGAWSESVAPWPRRVSDAISQMESLVDRLPAGQPQSPLTQESWAGQLQPWTQSLTDALLPLCDEPALGDSLIVALDALWRPDRDAAETAKKTQEMRACLEQLAALEIRAQRVPAGQKLLALRDRLCALRRRLGLAVARLPEQSEKV